MAASQDAVAYAYANVGVKATPSQDAVAYAYANVGVKATPSSDGVAYSYLNVTLPPSQIYLSDNHDWVELETVRRAEQRAEDTLAQAKTTAGKLAAPHATTTAGRPAPSSVDVGYQIFDTDLGQPLWSNGAAWVTATGTDPTSTSTTVNGGTP